jgi:hypothetical protein
MRAPCIPARPAAQQEAPPPSGAPAFPAASGDAGRDRRGRARRAGRGGVPVPGRRAGRRLRAGKGTARGGRGHHGPAERGPHAPPRARPVLALWARGTGLLALGSRGPERSWPTGPERQYGTGRTGPPVNGKESGASSPGGRVEVLQPCRSIAAARAFICPADGVRSASQVIPWRMSRRCLAVGPYPVSM